MANESIDVPRAEDCSAKIDAADTRGTPPVDTRETMWRAVKLYAWLATLICTVWGLWLLTAWVYREPPAKPKDPLEDVLAALKYGMSENEVRVIIWAHDRGHTNGLPYGGGYLIESTLADYPECYGDAGLDGRNPFHYKILRWSWADGSNVTLDGQWRAELDLYFKDGNLDGACYDHGWETHLGYKQRDKYRWGK